MTDAGEPTIPPAAAARLDELRRRGGGFFTSDLSVAEFMLLREGGLRPLTQVMGSCVYHVGWQQPPNLRAGRPWLSYDAGETFELETPTEAWNAARSRALARLREEATRAGADAVVGVRLRRAQYSWAKDLIEFVVTGTAVRSERYDLGGEPVLSNLSGQDFAKLLRVGWWPVGLVAGTTVAYVMTGWRQRAGIGPVMPRLRNQELPDFSRGVTAARAGALKRLEHEAHALYAHGVVGLQIDQKQEERDSEDRQYGYTDLWVETHVLGTAIAELAPGGAQPDVYSAVALDQEAR